MIYVAYRYMSGVVSKLFIFFFVHAFHTVDRVLHDLTAWRLAFLVLITLWHIVHEQHPAFIDSIPKNRCGSSSSGA